MSERKGKIGESSRQTATTPRYWFRRTHRVTFTPSLISIVLLVASTVGATTASAASIRTTPSGPSGLSAESNDGSGPLLISPGTWVTLTCTHGTISLDGTVYCNHTTTVPILLCDSTSCPFTMVGTVDSGYTFYGWLVGGQASVSCEYYCLTTTLTVYTPNSNNHYTASAQLDTTSAPPPPPSCGGAPSISRANPIWQNQSGLTRQVWVNWTYSIPTPSFGWWAGFSWYQGSTQLPIPLYNSSTTSASINLNALTAGTTYSYTVGIGNCGGVTTKSGTFTTLNAPTNAIAGWVSTMAPRPFEMDQIGVPISGAGLDVNVSCASIPYGGTSLETFPIGSSSTSGWYSTPTFPLSVQDIHGYGTYHLSSTGVCSISGWPSIQNSHLVVEAYASGMWSAVQYISSTLSVTNDYQQFGLPPDGVNHTAAGIAFVHTSLVECGVTVLNGGSQTVDGYVAGNGHTNIQGFGEILGGSPVWGSESWDTVSYHSTGIYNDSSGQILDAWTFGQPVGVGTNGFVPYVDPNPTPPAGSIVWTSGAGLSNQFGLYNGGSYTSQSGIEMSIGFSAGWTFAQGSASVDIDYTTSSTVSSTHQIICTSEAPPTGYDYQYWVYWDPNVQQNDQAVNIHVWYDDTCVIAQCVG